MVLELELDLVLEQVQEEDLVLESEVLELVLEELEQD